MTSDQSATRLCAPIINDAMVERFRESYATQTGYNSAYLASNRIFVALTAALGGAK